MINPDNFIFHSNFRYPVVVDKGEIPYTAEPLPLTVTVATGLTDTSIYRAFIEYLELGVQYLSDSYAGNGMQYYKDGTDLKVILNAQSPGQTFTGKIHWRVYDRKPADFTFHSKYAPEKTVLYLEGDTSTGNPVNTTGELLMMNGIWRPVGRPVWSAINSNRYDPTYDPFGIANLNIYVSPSEIQLFPLTPDGAAIEYKLSGVRLHGT